MKILAIETSCDETAASVVEEGRTVLSNVVYSQIPEHTKYGGVVPEIASRCHVENIVEVVDKALCESSNTLSSIDAIAVTAAPGLIGALLVGVNYAKGLALATNKPLIPVHHIRGHIAANLIAHPTLQPPFLSLVVSGGHTHIIEVLDYTTFHVVGQTRDDAAGEAFDKAARAMGFPYPGGIYIDQNAVGDHSKYKLPKPKVDGSSLDFSFSGLKTAVINLLHNAKQKGETVDTTDLCAAFQHTVSDILVEKTNKAAQQYGYTKLALAGGVCANSGVRTAFKSLCNQMNYEFFVPPIPLCADNAAMIASQAYYEYLAGHMADLSLNASASMDISKNFKNSQN